MSYASISNQVVNTVVGIIANATTNASTTIISPQAFNNIVATSTATNYALTLPSIPILNQSYSIVNNGAYFLDVFPSALGGTINGNANFVMSNNGCQATFECVNLTPAGVATWVVTASSGVGFITASAAFTLLACPAFQTVIYATALPYVITLPAIAASTGTQYKFIVSSAGANALTVTALTAVVNGYLIGNATKVGCVGQTSVIIGTGANSAIGDNVSYLSDGTHWNVQGFAQTTAAFTVQ